MSTIQDQYVAIAKQGQDAAVAVADAWTRSFQESATKFPSVPGPEIAHQVIDQLFDFAQTLVDVQRSLAKQLVSTSATVADEA